MQNKSKILLVILLIFIIIFVSYAEEVPIVKNDKVLCPRCEAELIFRVADNTYYGPYSNIEEDIKLNKFELKETEYKCSKCGYSYVFGYNPPPIREYYICGYAQNYMEKQKEK